MSSFRAPTTSTPSTPSGSSAATGGDPLDLSYISKQLNDYYTSLGLPPGQGASGQRVTDLVGYYSGKIKDTGGWVDLTAEGGNNIAYWRDRIKSDATKEGLLGATSSGSTLLGQGASTTVAGAQPIDPKTGRPFGASAHAPTSGTVVGTEPQTQGQQYAQAYAQALAARRRAGVGGRQSTILAGFNAGAPATQPATLLGRAA